MTLTATVPLPAGETTSISVDETAVRLVTATVPKLTAVTPPRFDPSMTTLVPPDDGPDMGERPVTIGGGDRTVVVVVTGCGAGVGVGAGAVVVVVVPVDVVTVTWGELDRLVKEPVEVDFAEVEKVSVPDEDGRWRPGRRLPWSRR